MKLNTYCQTCLELRINASGTDGSEGLSHYIPVDIQDNGLCEGTCPNGHRFASLFQNPKFELLFDLAGLALLDGYYREAVANFASSLERFYEFYTRALCAKNKRAKESFVPAWKFVANQSERQLGAFALLHFYARGVALDMRAIENKVPFRNNVIHKGMIPSRDEALAYGEVVIKFITARLIELRDDGCDVLSLAREDASYLAAGKSVLINEMVPTIIHVGHINEAEFGAKSLANLLVELSHYRAKVYSR